MADTSRPPTAADGDRPRAEPDSLRRRRFLAVCSAAGVAGTLLPGVLWARLQEQEEPTITAEMIADAEKLAGLELTDEERELMRQGLDDNLESYEALRQLPLPNDVPPALVFEPVMPGVEADPGAGDATGMASGAAYGGLGIAPGAAAAPMRISRQAAPTAGADPEDLAFLPVTQLSGLLRRREVSSEELARMYLERLTRFDPKLRAVVTLTEDLALKQARRADQEIAAGNWRGPLHGVPWGAKDLLATRDYPTSWGAAPFREQMIHEDATVVKRLESAGAVLVAKLTLGALAMGDWWFGGRTRSPWNLERGSSGSSAGPGAAVAAGAVGFGIGTETRGSIVSPATRNGVSALRPTFGRVSRAGAMALSWSMDKIGPMCRSAEDCALVFAAIHGADGIDPGARTAAFRWDPYRDLEELRVGYVPASFEPAERYDSRDRDLEVLRVLEEDLSVELVPVELPEFPVDAMGFLLDAEAAAAFDELTRSDRDDELTRQNAYSWPNALRTARLIPAVEYIQANRARTVYMRLFSEAIRAVDVFVTPSYRGGIVGATNLTGHPCAVVPNGFDEEGMPGSISFIGGLYRDAAALRVAHAYQTVTDFHRRHPDVDAQPMPSGDDDGGA